jgi:sensor c-di-GMP phosphodiesterase-like protein
MAHRLNLRVIAEGVESKGQLDFLRARGCHVAQGYYFSPALPARDFMEFFRNWGPAGAGAAQTVIPYSSRRNGKG